MPAPARKTPTRATQRAKSAAATTARREVKAEGAQPKPIVVPFRGVKFDIPRERVASEKVQMRQAHVTHFGTPKGIVDLLFDVLGPADSAGFIDLMAPGDTLITAAEEFFSALRKASGVPNS